MFNDVNYSFKSLLTALVKVLTHCHVENQGK